MRFGFALSLFPLLSSLISFISFFYWIEGIEGKKLKPLNLKMGSTPGVLTPGDSQYLSEMCMTRPSKKLDFKVELLPSFKKKTESGQHNRILLSVKKDGKKSRPPAWGSQHINSDDIQYIENLIAELHNLCPFSVKNCVMPETRYVFERRGIKYNITVSWKEWRDLPDIREGEWGSCALVGLGDNVFGNKRGKQIDNHDVVIRLGELPIERYKEYIGSKTDVIWARRVGKMAPLGTTSKEHETRRWYIGKHNGNVDVPLLKIFAHRKRIKQENVIIDSNSLADDLYKRLKVSKWNKNARRQKERSPTSGFRDALLLISSKFCQRIDLYGFSANCGGAYHNQNHLMQLTHNCELESWFFHYLMKTHLPFLKI